MNKNSNPNKKEYVSCMRLNGVPLLPPLLTEEERRQCRIYREQACLVEKSLEAKRQLKYKHAEVQVEEELKEEEELVSSCASGMSTSGDETEVLEFIRKALHGSADLEEVKLLISQVGEELKKQRSFEDHDSTYRDVASLSLNHSSDSNPREDETNYLGEERAGGSVINDDEDFEENTINEVTSPDSIDGGKLNSICERPNTIELLQAYSLYDVNISPPHPFGDIKGSESLVGKDTCCTDSKNDTKNQTAVKSSSEIVTSKSDDSGCVTPPKLIRSNSYTLESPSPSVLMYLRSLAVKNKDEKEEVSNSKVVKNLNYCWEDDNSILDISNISLGDKANKLNFDEGLESMESMNSSGLTQGRNVSADCSVLLLSDVSEPGNSSSTTSILNKEGPGKSPSSNSIINKNSLLPSYKDPEVHLKAAVIIQSAARGFLVRKLMKTQKIKDLKMIIKDAVLCAWSLYGEQAVSPADIQFHERIIKQVTAACYELHNIFFNWSTADRMALIKADREKLKNPRPRSSRDIRLSQSDYKVSKGRKQSDVNGRPSRERRYSASDSVSSSLSFISLKSRASTPRERPNTLPSVKRRTWM